VGPRTIQDDDVCLQYGNIHKLWEDLLLSDGKSRFIQFIGINKDREWSVF